MTITLAPENEAHLRQRAARDGKDVDAVANALLATVLADETDDRETVHRALLASGLVKKIARRTEPDTTERRLAEVQANRSPRQSFGSGVFY